MSTISYECRPASVAEHQQTALRLREHSEAVLDMAVEHAPFGLLAYEDQATGELRFLDVEQLRERKALPGSPRDSRHI